MHIRKEEKMSLSVNDVTVKKKKPHKLTINTKINKTQKQQLPPPQTS